MKLCKKCNLLFGLLLSFSTISFEYKIGVEDLSYYPLFDFRVDDHHQPSFTYELLSTFFNHHQIPFSFVVLPVKRFDKWYAENAIDFKFPDNERWREDKGQSLQVIFSDPVIELTAGTFVLKKNESVNREQVNKLITMHGFFPTLWFDRIDSGETELVEEQSTLSIVKHLLAENVKATNIDKNVINFQLLQLSSGGDIVLAKNIHHEKFNYHLSTIKHPEIIELFNKFLNENKKFVEQLKTKYHIVE